VKSAFAFQDKKLHQNLRQHDFTNISASIFRLGCGARYQSTSSNGKTSEKNADIYPYQPPTVDYFRYCFPRLSAARTTPLSYYHSLINA
jgi:hypothetical protein